MKRSPQEHTARVLGLCALFFGGLAGMAWAEGVFDRVGPEVAAALAVFAIAYAIATYVLDREVRAFVDRALRLRSAPGKSPAGKRAAT